MVRAALVALALLGAGCMSAPPSSDREAGEKGRAAAHALALGEAWRGSLDCEADRCARWHRVSLEEGGELTVDVQAPSGPGVPDFDLRLENDRGDVLWGFAPTGYAPRQIQRMLSPGDYYVVVESTGDLRGTLAYEVVARVREAGPVFEARDVEAARRAARFPRRPEVWVSADIVRVVGSAGLPSQIVLSGGARDDWRPGYRGELIEGAQVIATFVLIDVAEDESRARLENAPSDAITYETRARVRVPLE